MKPEHWSRVKDLLHAALERKRDERAGYLADACGADDVLRRDIESLLLASERAERFLETPAGLVRADGEAAATERVLRVGPYRILREIGRGGMAAVYLAVRDDGEYRKEVAIKVVQNAFASQFIVGRFRQERQILADFDHRNIARLLDGGTTEDGVPYLVLDHIAGSPIDAYCDEHALSLIERLRLFCDVCEAVGYAHQRHVIHRDLKPSNILVTADGTPKLLDFGIAKLLDGGDRPDDRTLTGWRLMTPEYASPEQLRGEPVGVPADVYALGVLLYRLVTGRGPYRPHNSQPHELARAICEDEPEMPSVVLRRTDASSDRSVESSHVRSERRSKRSRELAGDLDAIVMKALTKDPKNRYASVEQFADDVRRYLDRLPIMARRLTPLHHVRRLMRRSSRGRLAAAGLLLAIVGFTIVVSSRNRGESDRLASPPMTVSLLTTLAGSVSGPAFSADGNLIAFSWTGEGDSRTTRPGIYTVPVAGGTPMRLIAGSSGGEEWPAWSPDGSRIAFIREVRGGSGIFSVPTSGGPERKLLDLRDDRYLSLAWSPDGKHLAFADRNSRQEPYAISLLSLDTLERRRLPSPSRSSPQSILRFAFSPDGQTLAFIASGSHDDVEVGLLSLRDDKTKSIFSRREWIGGLTWTADGQALVLSLNHQGTRRLMKLPISGVAPELLPIEDAYYPALSRNGRRLAFVREVSDTDVWRIDLNGPSAEGKPVALIRSTRRDAEPRFSPDGKKIAFQSNRSGSLEVWVSDADGNNQVQLTSVNGPNVAWPSWSPDGRHIVFSGGAIYVVGSAGGPSSQLNRGETRGEAPFWSHDGSCIYFASGIIPNVWKVPAEGGQATQVTTNGAFSSRESPDGLYLYYSKNEARGIWRVPLSGGPETCVIEGFPEQFPDYWDVVDDGIYFIDSLTSPYPTIKFFSFVNGQKSTVAMLAGPAVDWGGGLTVSPDRRSILYTQSAYNRSEIVLVENFR